MTEISLQCTPKSIETGFSLMKKRIILLILISLLSSLMTSCAKSTDPADAYQGESPQSIYENGREALIGKSYTEATKRFEALDIQYPYFPETENAQLYLIYTYYMKEEYALSVAAADRFLRMHPASPHVDYALYMRGIANYYQNMGVLERIFAIDLAKRDLTQIQKSYLDFNQIVTRFPTSYYAPSAHQYMVYLRNVMAEHELQVAKYYYNRRAYVAAANRAGEIVAHYQGAPSVPTALVLMAKAYHQLGMTKLQQDTVSILQYNYPYEKINWDANY